MAQLRPIERAIPAHAHVNYTQDIEPRLDSCDGMPSTRGWSDVWVTIDFLTPMSSADLVRYVSGQVGPLGWVKRSPSPGDRGGLWNKTLSGATTSNLALDPGPYPNEWSLIAVAPPAGKAVTGC